MPAYEYSNNIVENKVLLKMFEKATLRLSYDFWD